MSKDGTRIGSLKQVVELRARIAELEAALAAERKRRGADETDAARYRWLREWRARWEIRYWGGMFWDSFNADKLDAAIDKEAAK